SHSNSNDQLFVLVVEGDSMVNAGILDNDRVVVKQQNTAENGDIVVAMTEDNEATIKRFYKEENHFRLQPENDTMDPIYLTNVSILGRLVGLYRSFSSYFLKPYGLNKRIRFFCCKNKRTLILKQYLIRQKSFFPLYC